MESMCVGQFRRNPHGRLSQQRRNLGGILCIESWPGGPAPWLAWLLEIAVRVWCRVAACCEVVVKVLFETCELVGCSLVEG
jgi:hypothetical protein